MSGNYTSFFMLVAFISHRPRRKLTSKEMEFLLWSTGKGVLDLARFADSKVECGATKKRKFILPGKKRTRKWFMNAFHAQEGATDLAPDHAEAGISVVYLGAFYQKRKDRISRHQVCCICSLYRAQIRGLTSRIRLLAAFWKPYPGSLPRLI